MNKVVAHSAGPVEPQRLTAPVECLDDETLVSFVRGAIDPAALGRIDEHLDQCESCFQIAAGLAGRLSRLPAPGERVGRYSVLEVLGQGATGVVVSAYDRELDRRIALKLLPSTNDDAQRWLEEARALARVSHPNVVGVFEVGQAEAYAFIAMELVAGQTLRAWLEVPRDWREIRKVFVDAARGLAAAHGRGVVHRDFKPDNVMINREGQAKVTDFGLARVNVGAEVTAELREDLPVHRTKAAGTPAYMAPELFERRNATPASDQFAFAVSLWEAFFTERPFRGDDLASLAVSVKESAPQEPKRSHRVPGFILAALHRALDKNPEARFESMSALALALTRDERTSQRRRPWIAVGVAVLVTSVVVATTFDRFRVPSCDTGKERFSTHWNDASRAKIFTAQPAHQASAQRLIAAIDRWGEGWADVNDRLCKRSARKEQSDALHDLRVACLDRALLAVEPFASRAASDPTGKGLDAAFDKLDDVLPDTSACLHLDPTGVKQLPDDGRRAQVESVVARAAALRASLVIEGPMHAATEIEALSLDAKATRHEPIVGEVAFLAADVARELGDFEGARRSLGEALLAFGNARDRRAEATTWLRFLSLQGRQGLYAEAEHTSKLVYSLLLGLGSPSALELEYRETMGAVHTSMGRLEDAEADLQRALEIERGSGDGPSRARSRILTNLGNLARAQGDLDLALERHRLAKDLDQERLGPANVNVPRHLHNIAGVLKMMGQREEALAAYRESLARCEGLVGRDGPDCAVTQNSLGIFLAEDGDLELGRKHLLEAKRIFALTAHAHETIAKENLAWLARLDGEPAEVTPAAEPPRRGTSDLRPKASNTSEATTAASPPPSPAPSVQPSVALRPPTPASSATSTAPPSRMNTPNGSGAYVPSPAWP